jgi:hypothetical protein
MNTSVLQTAYSSGLSPDEYNQHFSQRAHLASDPSSQSQDDHLQYVLLNKQRTARIEKTYTPSPEIIKIVEKIEAPQTWLIITEDWCGDSSQIVPYILSIAKLSPHITVRFLLRDSFPEIMDKYLTNGTRSIPKIIAFNTQSEEEIWTWGPRPAHAAQGFIQRKAEGMAKSDNQLQLHKWYAQDKGKSIEKEIGDHILSACEITI